VSFSGQALMPNISLDNKKWLFDLIKDGTLVDNQSYSCNDGLLNNIRFHEPVSLNTKSKGQRKISENDEDEIWKFLNKVAKEVNSQLNQNASDAIILFNDHEYEHNTEDKFINITGIDARNFELQTGNLIGFVKKGDYSLKISSRFGDNFLKYIISDADGFLEIKNAGGEDNSKSSDGYEWLLAYLWNIKLKKAYRLGLPKAYITKTERIPRARGNIDTVDYFQSKIPGKYLCSYREHSYSTPALSLFIEAYKLIKDPYSSFCQNTRSIYSTLVMANEGKKRTRKDFLETKNFTNPFYSDYNTLIDMSKKIITQNGTSFDTAKESSAFFFDISMLFEYFIRKLLKRYGISLLSKSQQNCQIPTGAAGYIRKLEPDIYFEHNNYHYLFDVKYKRFDFIYGVSREDLFQLHTYIGQYGNISRIKGCGFIYPISENNWNKYKLDECNGLIRNVIEQQGRSIPFYVLFIKIPENSLADFNSHMLEECKKFMEKFNGIIDSTL
tara:strand:+ start:3399 stop:4892 length:1494 start_codon:yes stop_codon:yes gene_type:complete